MGLNLGEHFGPRYIWGPNRNLSTVGNRQNFAEFGYRVNAQRELFYIERVSRFYPVLFPTSLKYSIIHDRYSGLSW